MHEFETIRFDIDARNVAVITLARKKFHNAINAQMIVEIRHATKIIHEEKSVRACILQSDGNTFCAGGDLTFMRTQMKLERSKIVEGAHDLTDMLSGLDNLPCPLIGKLQGPVYGGGLGIVSVCDFVVAADHVKFALSETLLGLVPATIGPFLLRRIGEAWARQYFFIAKTFDVNIAQRMNLVSSIVSLHDLNEEVEKEVTQILKCQPGAVNQAKAYAKKLARNPASDFRKSAAELFADRLNSDEAKLAIDHFLSGE